MQRVAKTRGTFDRGFIASSQGGAQDPGQGVKSLEVAGSRRFSLFPPLASTLHSKPSAVYLRG